jgi:hypothetical protein
MNTLHLPIPVNIGSVQMNFLYGSLRKFDTISTLNWNHRSRAVGDIVIILELLIVRY